MDYSGISITNSHECLYDSNIFYEVSWEEDLNFNGWDISSGVAVFGVWNSVLFGTALDNNPYIQSRDFFPIDAEYAYIIRFNMLIEPKSNTYIKEAKLMWVRDGDTTWNDEKSVTFPVVPDSNFRWYTVNLGPSQWWQGQISKLRLYPCLNCREGDRFFIRKIEVYSPSKHVCSNPSCDYFNKYSHPCPGVGLRGYSESLSVIADHFEINSSNCELIVNIDNYGYQILKLDFGSFDRDGLISNINKQLGKIGIGGFCFSQAVWNVDRLRIYSGSYSSNSCVTVGYSALAEILGFWEKGKFVGTTVVGKDPASGFDFKASYRLSRYELESLLSKEAEIKLDPNRYSVEAGRVDWFFESQDYNHEDYDDIHFFGSKKTVVDFTHPFNNSGRISKAFISGRIPSGETAKLKIFRPLMDGTLELIYEISFGQETQGSVYTKRHDAYELDLDFVVEKGDLVGFYNVEFFSGISITDFPDAMYCIFDSDVTERISFGSFFNNGNLGLSYYVRGSRKLDSIILDLDFQDSLVLLDVDLLGERTEQSLEFNISGCEDVNWSVNLFNGVHHHLVCDVFCWYVEHQNIAYGLEALNDGKIKAFNGIAGTSWGRDSNGLWTSGEHSYFYVNGDCEWLEGAVDEPSEFVKGSASHSCPTDFDEDPVELVVTFPIDVPIVKTRVFFKDRENYQRFSWSYYVRNRNGNSDNPQYSYIEYDKVWIDNVEVTDTFDTSVVEVLFSNPTSLVWKGEIEGNVEKLPDSGSNFASYAISWNVLAHEFNVVTKSLRFFTNYHKSTKISEIQVFTEVELDSGFLNDVLIEYYNNIDWNIATNSILDGGISGKINDVVNRIKIKIVPTSQINISGLGLTFYDLDCSSDLYLVNNKRGYCSDFYCLDLENKLDSPARLKLDIPDDNLNTGLILNSKLESAYDIEDPQTGPGGILYKNDNFIFKNNDRNIAINCKCYALDNLVDQAPVWFNYYNDPYNFDFDLNNHSTVFPRDLKFTSSDGITVLDHYVTHIENGVAYVWVKVDEDLSSDKDIYVYYGSNSEDIGSPDNIFEFFDDFSNGFDTSKWEDLSGYIIRRNERDNAVPLEEYEVIGKKFWSGTYPKLYSDSAGIQTVQEFDISQYCFGARIKANYYLSDVSVGLYNFKGSTSPLRDGNGVLNAWHWEAPVQAVGTVIKSKDRSWHLAQIFHTKFARLDGYPDVTTGFEQPTSLMNKLVIAAVNGYGSNDPPSFFVDYVFVRKCVYPEPVFSQAFDEEYYLDDHSVWLNGWKYRKKIHISGSSGAGTDYPILLKIREWTYDIWGLNTFYSQNQNLENYKAKVSKLSFFPVSGRFFKLIPKNQTCFSDLVEVLPYSGNIQVEPDWIKTNKFLRFSSAVWDLSSISCSDWSFNSNTLTFNFSNNEVCEFSIRSKFKVDKFPNIEVLTSLSDLDNTGFQLGFGFVSEDGSIFRGIRAVLDSGTVTYYYDVGSWGNSQDSDSENFLSGFKLVKIPPMEESNSFNYTHDQTKYYYKSTDGWIKGFTYNSEEFFNNHQFFVELYFKKETECGDLTVILSDFTINDDSVFFISDYITSPELIDDKTFKTNVYGLSGVSSYVFPFSASEWDSCWDIYNREFLYTDGDYLKTKLDPATEASLVLNGYIPVGVFEIDIHLKIFNIGSVTSGRNVVSFVLEGISSGEQIFLSWEYQTSYALFKYGVDPDYRDSVGASNYTDFKIRLNYDNGKCSFINKYSGHVASNHNFQSDFSEKIGFKFYVWFSSGVRSPQTQYAVKFDFIHDLLPSKTNNLELFFDNPVVLDSLVLLNYGDLRFSEIDLYVSNDGVNYNFNQPIDFNKVITEIPYNNVAFDLGKRYALDFIRSYGDSPLMFFNESTVIFSKSDVDDASQVEWGNTDKSDARWFKVNISPSNYLPIKKVGVYPDVGVTVAPGLGYNSSWSYLGNMLTSFPREENLCYNATISGSSYFDSMYPKYAINGIIEDGISTNVWGSDSNSSQWLIIYFDQIYDISKINLYFGFGEITEDFMINDYSLAVSEDDTNYTTILSVTNNTEYYRQHLFSDTRAKSVKLNITKYSAGVIDVSGEGYFRGAVVREIEIFRDISTEQDYIDSETYPVVAIDNLDVFNINSIEFYKKDGWDDTYSLWSKDSGNLRCSDNLVDDPKNVTFNNYGLSFPNRYRWLCIKQVDATNYPSNGSTKKYLYKVKEFSSDLYRITRFPWWWKTTSSTVEREYLIKDDSSTSSLKLTTVSGTDQFEFIEGTNFGIDDKFSEMDFVSFDLYCDNPSNLTLSNLKIGDFDYNRYHSWDLSNLVLNNGWTTIKLKWKDADKVIPSELDSTELTNAILNNYRDLVLKSFILTYNANSDTIFYIDDIKIQRNTFDETLIDSPGLYLCNNEFIEFPLSEFDPHHGSLEFYLKPDFNFNSADSFFESFSRTFFSFSNISNDVFGFFMLRGIGPAIAVGNSKFIKVEYVGYASDIYFTIGEPIHLLFLWSHDGSKINKDGTTAAIYINGILAGKTYDTWQIQDSLTTRLLIGGSISQRASKEKPSSIWGVINNLKVYNYCIDVNGDDNNRYSANDFIEFSLDGLTYYTKNSSELPIILDYIQPGESVLVYVRSNLPRFINNKSPRTSSLLVEWIKPF